jgi:DNA-binding beta-propeller fold protein YncE
MKHHPTFPKSGLSRRSVVGRAVGAAAALSLGSRLGRALADEAETSAGPVEFLWETSGDPDDPLGNPAHLAIAPDGSIWVADGDNDRFLIFAPDGSLLEAWGTAGSGEGEFDFTTIGWGGYDEAGIAFAPDGAFYVTDTGNHRIQKFGPDRGFLTAWGSEGQDTGQFDTPIDLVVDGQGRVYVLDSFRNIAPTDPETGAVQVFDADGRFLAEWGVYGDKPGQMHGPFGIGLDPDGTLLVAEFDNNRVQRFTPEGELLDGWGEYGSADGEFIWAMDAAVDTAGRVFVTDYANDRVQVFDHDGRFLAAWGGLGYEAGKFSKALGVAVNGDGIVYVTDGSKRLQAFRVGDLPAAE